MRDKAAEAVRAVVGKMDAADPRTALAAFVAFTVVQIFVFMFRGGVYADLGPKGFDAAPHYPVFFLLGAKEVGLMAIYTAAIVEDDERFMWMTVMNRLTTIPFSLWLTLVLGAPHTVWGGVAQDMCFSAWTVWALRKRAAAKDHASKHPQSTEADHASRTGQVLRLVVFVAGMLELMSGVLTAIDPVSHGPVPDLAKSNPGFDGNFLGIRSFGYMTALVGSYQVLAALAPCYPRVLLVMGLHHLCFWVLTAGLGHDRGVVPWPGHVVLGAATLLLSSMGTS